jgi:hypothetical protein
MKLAAATTYLPRGVRGESKKLSEAKDWDEFREFRVLMSQKTGQTDRT